MGVALRCYQRVDTWSVDENKKPQFASIPVVSTAGGTETAARRVLQSRPSWGLTVSREVPPWHRRRLVVGALASMLQDIRAGKRTEIDALNGAVVQLGQQHGIATPTNTTVTRMIQFMENRPGA